MRLANFLYTHFSQHGIDWVIRSSKQTKQKLSRVEFYVGGGVGMRGKSDINAREYPYL